MNKLPTLLPFMWEFVVGDDWRIAAGVLAALGLTALVAGSSVPAWWIVPLATAMLLRVSLGRAADPRR